VVGAREQDEKTISVRRRAGDDLGAMPVPAFLERVGTLVAGRSTEL
jgi:threonyl-tRNA synthetase